MPNYTNRLNSTEMETNVWKQRIKDAQESAYTTSFKHAHARCVSFLLWIFFFPLIRWCDLFICADLLCKTNWSILQESALCDILTRPCGIGCNSKQQSLIGVFWSPLNKLTTKSLNNRILFGIWPTAIWFVTSAVYSSFFFAHFKEAVLNKILIKVPKSRYSMRWFFF